MNKKIFSYITVLTLILCSCSKWTETEIKNPANLKDPDKSEIYYSRLRDYKKTDHPVAFGWFGNWTGTGASYENSLRGLPDSTDFVSLWGNWKNPSDAMLEDLRFVQQKKGTRALVCFLVLDIGDQITPPIPEEEKEAGLTDREWRHKFWGWDLDIESRLAAVEKYANAICDTIEKYNYDGFDLDAEPRVPQPFPTDKELWKDNGKVIVRFVETMSRRIGPKSGTGKMFVVDGEPDALPDSLFTHFDYLILQAYTSYYVQDNSRLDDRFKTQYEHFKDVASAEDIARKIIVCENFENFAKTGGAEFRLPYNNPDGTPAKTTSLKGFAYWNPTHEGVQYRKGGVGTFHMEYEYKVSPQSTETYPALRAAIQIQNPSHK